MHSWVNGCVYTDHSKPPQKRVGGGGAFSFSLSTHPLVFGFWVQAPLHSFHPQLLLGRVHVKERFSAQVQFLKTGVIKQVKIWGKRKASQRKMYRGSWPIQDSVNSHWPQSINIRRFCVTAEPWLEAAVWRLAVHVPCSSEKPKETESGATLMHAAVFQTKKT